MGHWSHPPSIVCGRSRMYRLSQMTSGRLTVIHAMVMFDAVWAHGSEGEDLDDAIVLETARLARDLDGEVLRSGEPGAGDAVEVRERLVGDGSGGGNSDG